MTEFGVYVHVPFCASRCGYCDFNTYTSTELGGGGAMASYADHAIAETRQARDRVGDRDVSTVFFGGGTPTMLPAADLARILDAIRSQFSLAVDAEITTEANPESVDEGKLAALRQTGFTRVSFGMQSAAEHVLATLDRQHTPGGALRAVALARATGFEHINVDLIYNTPGETNDDWQRSLDAAVESGADHVSAYSLIVEPATRLALRIRRGELPMPDDDVAADRYLMAEETLSRNGFEWYEVSNWARDESGRSRHNLLYWTGDDWWGIGPGAHSHLDGLRWWNVKHPSEYAKRIEAGESPEQDHESLDAQTRRTEDIMLRIRLRAGLSGSALDAAGRAAADRLVEDGLLDQSQWAAGRAVLTLRGRLLADAVVRSLAD